MKYYLILFFVTVCFISSKANLYHVGPTRYYVSPNALYLSNVLLDGDTIEIDAGNYSGTAALANWSRNHLYILGIGGRPHMMANGQNLNGKSIWITSGNHITIDNIEFSGCSVPDHNGAGIRAEGPDFTIRHCYFHDNENGILTNNPNSGDILIEHSEFNHNGYGDGYTHNVYVGHVNKLTFRYNYSHHAVVGHNLKSRANINIIIYNRIMDEATGNSSRLIDLPNGGFSLVMGNLLMQGVNAVNNNIIGYGLEGLSNQSTELFIVNNTFINKRVASCLFISLQSGTSVAQIVNNIFGGTGTLINGTATSMSNNYQQTDINNIMLSDEANYDYHLTAGSPVVNAGSNMGFANGYSLTPVLSYLHTSDFEARPLAGIIDIGAYEYDPCKIVNTEYFFNGTVDQSWTNGANWNNGCLPPSPYNGQIFIMSDCIANGIGQQLFLPGAQLTIQSGANLTWLW